MANNEFEDIQDDFLDADDSFLDAPLGVTEEAEPESYLTEELPEEPAVGKLSAFAQQAAPTATLGLSDILGGAAGALGHAIGSEELPSKKELLEKYYEAKQETVQRREQAMEEQPAASIAGMVAGGFATPLPGAGIAKLGKVGKAVSRALPSLKGTDKISKAGKLAEKARLVGNIDRYKALKGMQRGAAAKLALKEGTKAGAISGATLGESKLLEGDVQGFVDDTLSGGVAGAGLGYGFIKGTQVTGSLIRKLPGIQNAIDSFKFGSRGIDLNEAEVNNEINKAASKFIKEFDNTLGALKIDKQKVLDQVDELGITINGRADIEKARQVVNRIESASERKRAQQFLDVLDDYLGDGKAYKKAKNSLEKKIAKARFIDPVAEARVKQQKIDLKDAIEKERVPISSEDLGTVSSKDILPGEGPEVKAQVRQNIYEKMTDQGIMREHQMRAQDIPEFKPSNIQRAVEPETGREVAFFKDFGKGKVHAIVGDEAKALNVETLSTDQANRLKGLMNEYSALAKKENMPNDVRRAATEAAKMINDKINGAAEKIGKPIASINRKMSNLMGAKERIGIGRDVTANDKEDSLKSMAKFIAGIGDKNPVTDKNLVLQRLKKVDPNLAEEISAQLDDLRRQYELTKPTETMSATNSAKALMGTVNGVWNKAWNILGQSASAPFKAVKKGSDATKRYLANKTLDFVEATPSQMQGLITKIQESGNKAYDAYAAPIQRAIQAKPRTKQAILYGLYQQPSFREMVDSLHTETPEEE